MTTEQLASCARLVRACMQVAEWIATEELGQSVSSRTDALHSITVPKGNRGATDGAAAVAGLTLAATLLSTYCTRWQTLPPDVAEGGG